MIQHVIDPGKGPRFAGPMTDRSSSDWRAFVFWTGFALLLGHEMDAMVRHEWRLLPGFSAIADDALARDLFTLAHIPLYAVLIWLAGHTRAVLRTRTQWGIDLFLVAHGAVHFILSDHRLYEFEPPVETITVYGAALVGAVHLAVSRRIRVRQAP